MPGFDLEPVAPPRGCCLVWALVLLLGLVMIVFAVPLLDWLHGVFGVG